MSANNNDNSDNNNINNNVLGFDEVLDVPPSLRTIGVTNMGRYNEKFLILYELQTSNNEINPIMLTFDIKKHFSQTLDEFEKKARSNPSMKLQPTLIQKTKIALSMDEGCRKILALYDKQQSDNAEPSIVGGPIGYDISVSSEIEIAYASSASDPDYTDEGLPLISPSQAIRADQGPARVHGIIDSVRNLFRLITQIRLTCRNEDCVNDGHSVIYQLFRPIYDLNDLPIAWENLRKDYDKFMSCSRCHQPREPRFVTDHFASAKVIEMTNVNKGPL
jgi:hypothetical protein